MSVQQAVCTHCRARLRLLKRVVIGTRVRCPKCRKPFTIDDRPSPDGPESLRPAQASRQRMPLLRKLIYAGVAVTAFICLMAAGSLAYRTGLFDQSYNSKALVKPDTGGVASVSPPKAASAKHPGGGFLGGARAQEESLARSSGLYACINGNPMYDHHKAHGDAMYTDYAIYSPDPLCPTADNTDKTPSGSILIDFRNACSKWPVFHSGKLESKRRTASFSAALCPSWFVK